jgi:hypothetical protein
LGDNAKGSAIMDGRALAFAWVDRQLDEIIECVRLYKD